MGENTNYVSSGPEELKELMQSYQEFSDYFYGETSGMFAHFSRLSSIKKTVQYDLIQGDSQTVKITFQKEKGKRFCFEPTDSRVNLSKVERILFDLEDS
ncbi:MAG: hypothetical protein KC516_02360, partial [Nanoarchaeota archaeon]|nr:hypothetical protein [Nanoarchaeota archaeon]